MSNSIFSMISILILLILMSVPVLAQTDGSVEEDIYETEFSEVIEEDIYEGVEEIQLDVHVGLTPDSPFYFLESLVESILVGNNPEAALNYKEEKVMELKQMIEEGNEKGARKALDRMEKYNKILKKEVSPDNEERVLENSKAVKEMLGSFEGKLEGDVWDEVRDEIDDNIKEEDKIALAAKISTKIEELCKTLADLDPLEYSRVCKTSADDPKWKKELDKELTEKQEKEAKEFFGIMSECFQDPGECRCVDISVKAFADQCSKIAPIAAECEAGNEESCRKMEGMDDPIELLPDYLQAVMGEVEDKYGEAKHNLHIPTECVQEGALSKDDCMKVMFKIHAPPECVQALERGEIDPKNEKEAREACDKITFELEAPQECLDAGLSDFRECDRLMFRLDAPSECIEAGLTGSGKDDWKKCDAIRFKLDAPQECLDAGLDGSGRDDWKECDAIKFRLDAPQECLDAGLDGSGRDDWKKCDAIKFRLDSPQECLDAGLDGTGRNDWKECDIIRFKSEAHPDCLAAGLTGEGRNDWRECERIRFSAEAPPECIAAGLDGSGKNDWDQCHRIQDEMRGESREDCNGNELHICDDDGYNCRCISKEEYDKSQGYEDDSPYADCGAVDCSEGYHCEYGACVPDADNSTAGCHDCESKCPGASRTDCVNDQCECYYEETESECKDGCQQECGDQNTDCVDQKCVCRGYGENGPPSDQTQESPQETHEDIIEEESSKE